MNCVPSGEEVGVAVTIPISVANKAEKRGAIFFLGEGVMFEQNNDEQRQYLAETIRSECGAKDCLKADSVRSLKRRAGAGW